MSIQKDVEKMYREDQDKQRRKKKKKKSGSALLLVILIVIIVLLLLLMKYLGIGFGGGSGGKSAGENAASGAADRTVTADESGEDTSSEEQKTPMVIVGIKVSGSVYIYNDQVYELDTLRETIGMMKENVAIEITDDNSTQNAMEALTTALAEDGREYLIMPNLNEELSSEEQSAPDMTVTTLVP